MRSASHPARQGMYDPRNEHDACGVGFVATLTGEASHELVEQALTVLRNLEHRGATGSEPDSGDGAGILVQVPDAFLRDVTDFDLPEAGSYAVGIGFLPEAAGDEAAEHIERIAAEEELTVLGWREVPVAPELLGNGARTTMPAFRQLFVADGTSSGLDLDRKAFVLRKRAEREADVYFPSLSSRTVVYKGMLTTGQLEPFFPDLSDRRFATAIALVHSRFSTNTFPSWPLAHPYRFVAHNGEINTVQGNRNWMRARESQLVSDLFGEKGLDRIFPLCTPDASDSATFDEVLELLHLGGRSLPHSVLMMVPEAWENHPSMDPARRAFYQYHSTMMEPWDGPACVTFTDGTQVGAVLDRNGLRPGRYWVTDDGLVVLSSEVGVLDIDPAKVVRKGRLQPGRMFLVDTAEHRIIEDDEIKAELATEQPYGDWLEAGLIDLADLPEREHIVHTHASVTRRQQTFGYTEEELRVLLAPMAKAGAEPIGSMGTDSPIAALSERPRLLFDYFTQLFAQVTNPPLDAIREELVTSLISSLGPQGNLLEPTAASCRSVTLPFPVIDNDELAKLIHINADGDMPGLKAANLSGLYRVSGGGDALAARLAEICAEADAAIEDGARLIVLSDRHSDAEHAPIPSLLLTSAVHHHLIGTKQRTQVGLLVEAGDVREVHHVALLIGYGAAAVNPYLAMESVEDLVRAGTFLPGMESETAIKNLIKALGKGVLKVMSKMGISTVASYRGAQVFEAVGLDESFVDAYFHGTATKIGGAGLDIVAKEVAARHAKAYPATGIPSAHRALDIGGEYQWRREGEPHLFDPETVFRLQHSTRARRYDIFKKYTERVNEQSERLMTLRGLFSFKDGERPSIPIEEVEPVSEIVKRFSTGAMSYGSISQEAHETLAIAMNQLGGKSNTGEGGEDSDRLHDPARRSSIKQVASGRFGVTSEYLVNSDDIQIKMAQGAKPGEGGQLPGHKVYPWVAKTRHSTPGVGLISPPPHHDIYSIEDLAQLIHDLKNANPKARIHVKLVSFCRRRHRRRGRLQGARRCRADLRPRRRHRRLAAHLAQARGRPLGAGSRRDPADAAAQRAARPYRRADRRPAEDRPRRGDRRAARCRGVRLRDRAAGRLRLRDDARMPPGHLPGRHRHPEPGAARALQRPGRVRGQLLPVHRRGGPRAPRRAGLPHPGRGHRPRRAAGHRPGRAALEGAGPGPRPAAVRPRAAGGRRPPPGGRAGPRPGEGPGQRADQARGGRAERGVRRVRPAGPRPGRDPQHQPDRRHHARSRGDAEVRRRGPAGRHHRHHLHRLGRPVLRRVRAPRCHAAAGGRRQRLRRQGPVRRPRDRPPGPGRRPPRRVLDHRGQHPRVRRDRRRDVSARQGRRAVLRPQLGRDRGLRGRGRPRLRVHDRRPGRRPRPDRAQLRGRDVRWHRVRHRPRPGQRQRRPPRRRRRAGRHRQAVAARRCAPPPGGDRFHRRGRAARRLGPRPRPLRQDHPRYVPGRARRQGRRRASRTLRVRDPREDDGGGDQWLTPRAS
ncbi:glutamate synthase large subunit [Streptomyces himastatinicus ATCC 53653]|uniref:Glutamate synthase large subunit n=1 Tax=Streptomyces himastatinicus ATCC 53653 TaxID=457427 RepID=D9WAI9_9ACTN|nr:glutamate synthase large subunit [Streptomyces himastatinicus ATCC 53653]